MGRSPFRAASLRPAGNSGRKSDSADEKSAKDLISKILRALRIAEAEVWDPQELEALWAAVWSRPRKQILQPIKLFHCSLDGAQIFGRQSQYLSREIQIVGSARAVFFKHREIESHIIQPGLHFVIQEIRLLL